MFAFAQTVGVKSTTAVPKKDVQMPFRVTPTMAEDLERAAAATEAKVQELLREAAAAIVRAHKRSRDGRVPKDMEIRPRYYPEAEEMNWDLAEAPPGETINAVMAQSTSVVAAELAIRLRGEVVLHPHFVHARSRGRFLDCVISAFAAELAALAPEGEDPFPPKKTTYPVGRRPRSAAALSESKPLPHSRTLSA